MFSTKYQKLITYFEKNKDRLKNSERLLTINVNDLLFYTKIKKFLKSIG